MFEKLLFWKKTSPKPQEVLHRGLEFVKQFTTEDEPKCADYPIGKYKAYWEIVLGEVAGGYSATVRIYGFGDSAFIRQDVFTGATIPLLKKQVDQHILSIMPQFER